ncbi:hypothetical protein ANO11243_049460 [Dothideomycetidae sp. 11243]|nr:hypothetical protein ANO11243_049460 [fungal sp. No.11243]
MHDHYSLHDQAQLIPFKQKPEYDHEYDLVVVGSGAGGLTAAVTAATSGAKKVLVVEKTLLYGGTTAFSGGALWLPLNPLSMAQGSKDTREQAERYLHSALGSDYNKELISAYLDSAPAMVDYLESRSATRFVPVPAPDYYMHLDGALASGRTLFTASFDGRRLGKMVKQVRYPLQGYCAFGSMQTDFANIEKWRKPFGSLRNFSFVTRALLRYAFDQMRYRKGTLLCNGNGLVGRLLEAAIKADVELWNNAPAVEPIRSGSRVTGIVINKDGKDLRIGARRGVVVASGGFARSAELSRKHLPTQGWTVGPRGNVGDGLRIGKASGGTAPDTLTDNALWTPVSEYRPRGGAIRTYPHFTLGLTKPGSMIVDGDGNRFANESAPYQDLGRATHAAGVKKEFLIGDRRHLRQYGMGIALPAPYPIGHLLRRGYLIQAPTIAALASKIGIDPRKLVASVQRFNTFAREGKDLDFGRGEGSYDKANGDPSVTPNSCMAPLEHGPFYAVPMYPGTGVTMYGLRTNKDAQVLNSEGEAVPGLYAVGADAAHFMNGRYPSGGLTLGPAMVFGFRAGLHIAGQK